MASIRYVAERLFGYASPTVSTPSVAGRSDSKTRSLNDGVQRVSKEYSNLNAAERKEDDGKSAMKPAGQRTLKRTTSVESKRTSKLRTTDTTLEAANQTLKDEVDNLKSRLHLQQKFSQKNEAQIMDLRQRCDRMTDENSELEKQNSFLGKQAKHFKEMAQEQTDSCRVLEDQVSQLKHKIAMALPAETQITDDWVRTQWRTLAEELQTWVVTTFFSSEFVIPIDGVAPHVLRILQAMPQAPDISQIVRAIVGHHLRVICDNPSPYTNNATAHVIALSAMMRGDANLTEEQRNQWRWITYNIIYNVSEDELRGLTQIPRHMIAANIKMDLDSISDTPLPVAAMHALENIMFHFIQCLHTVRQQKARYCTEFFAGQNTYSHGLMENEYGMPAPHLSGHQISMTVFPMLFKQGDENGKNMTLQNVICKARMAVIN